MVGGLGLQPPQLVARLITGLITRAIKSVASLRSLTTVSTPFSHERSMAKSDEIYGIAGHITYMMNEGAAGSGDLIVSITGAAMKHAAHRSLPAVAPILFIAPTLLPARRIGRVRHAQE